MAYTAGTTKKDSLARATRLFLGCLALLICLTVVPRPTLAEDVPNNGIPVLSITLTGEGEESPSDAFDAINNSPDHSVGRAGTLSLSVPAGYAGDYSAEALQNLGPISIEHMRGRGNSTWEENKKAYKIKLSKGADLLGMGSNKHWVLLANSMDASFLRNRVASYLGSALGLEFTPKMLPVDLVVNGNYNGSYFLSEHVRIGKTRVNIDELKPGDDSEPAITGGYLLAMTPKADEPEENRITTAHEVQFCGDDPDFGPDGSGTEAQKAYLAGYLQQVEDAIYGDGFADANGVRWDEYMDLVSTAKYWWVQELMGNSPDAYWTPSTYLYKKRDGKLYWGPLWDFDQSANNATDGLTYTSTPWLDYLRSFDPVYQDELRTTWTQLDAIIEDVVKPGGVLDQYANEIRTSWQADFDLWVKDTPAGPFAATFDENVEQLRAWLSQRRDWINANIAQKLNRVMCKVTFVADDEVVGSECLYLGHALTSLPAWPQKEGKVFLGWITQDGSAINKRTVFNQNTVATATYADAEDGLLGKGLFFNAYDLWLSLDDDAYETGFTVVPDDSQERYATWTSSDPEVATVDAFGIVRPCSVGDTTITAMLMCGASASYTLHVIDSSNDLSLDVDALEPERTKLELDVGEYGQVRVSIQPQANPLVLPSYRSEDEGIATVDNNGVVKGIAPGTTTITAFYPEEDGGWPSASYEVVVSNESADAPEPQPKPPSPDSSDEPGGQEAPEGQEALQIIPSTEPESPTAPIGVEGESHARASGDAIREPAQSGTNSGTPGANRMTPNTADNTPGGLALAVLMCALAALACAPITRNR